MLNLIQLRDWDWRKKPNLAKSHACRSSHRQFCRRETRRAGSRCKTALALALALALWYGRPLARPNRSLIGALQGRFHVLTLKLVSAEAFFSSLRQAEMHVARSEAGARSVERGTHDTMCE
jgi:hypothetical protein